jgi:aspartyl-tRNA(Asn)/glutamyl-tRNA(Gln) amidotransferase subunit C
LESVGEPRQFNNPRELPQGNDGMILLPVFDRESSHVTLTLGRSMSLNRADIENIARLARLELTEAEIPVHVDSLSRIFAFVGELDRAPTAGIAPMAHPLPGLAQRPRPDEVVETDHRELYQRNAPRVEAGLYLLPRVIE